MFVVLDTNILVSAVVAPRGNEAQVVQLIASGQVGAFVSRAIVAEYEEVLGRRKFQAHLERAEIVLSIMRELSTLAEPGRRLRISADESDNRFLECCESSGADYLITGNLKHFPARHGRTKVLNAASFLILRSG